MFDTSGLRAQIAALKAEVAQRDSDYCNLLQREALAWIHERCDIDTTKIVSIDKDMRELSFSHGIRAQLSHGMPEIDYRHHKELIVSRRQNVSSCSLHKSTFHVRDFAPAFRELADVMPIAEKILFGFSEHWQQKIRPQLTPEFLSLLYQSLAFRWIAAQYGTSPLADVLRGSLIPLFLPNAAASGGGIGEKE